MRVLVDGRVIRDSYHGIGRHTYSLLLELAALDVTLTVLCPTESGRYQLEALADHRNVKLLRSGVPVVSARSQGLLAMASMRHKPDAMLVPYHLSLPLVLPTAPTVTVIHDCIFEQRARSAKGLHPALAGYCAFTRAAIRRSTVVATVSEATRGDLEAFYGVDIPLSAVVPHGVGSEFFTAAGTHRPNSFALPQRYILHVGARRPHKNQHLLVQALAELGAADRDVGLVLVGDGNRHDHNDLDEVIASRGLADRVHTLGQVSEADLLALYANCSVFAYPSLAEGFGLPLLEAMAVGAPVVASDIPVVREVTCGAAALLPPSNPLLWADTLAHVLHDPSYAAELVTRGRIVVRERSWKESAARTLKLLVSASDAREPKAARP